MDGPARADIVAFGIARRGDAAAVAIDGDGCDRLEGGAERMHALEPDGAQPRRLQAEDPELLLIPDVDRLAGQDDVDPAGAHQRTRARLQSVLEAAGPEGAAAAEAAEAALKAERNFGGIAFILPPKNKFKNKVSTISSR